jgi:hypothetical protein
MDVTEGFAVGEDTGEGADAGDVLVKAASSMVSREARAG